MEILATFFAILCLLFLVAAVIGLINPRFVKQPSRKRGFFVNFVSAVLFFVLTGVVAPNDEKADESPSVEEKPDISQSSAIENKSANVNQAISGEQNETRPHRNLIDAINGIESNYAVDVEYSFGEKYCTNDNYCEAMADKVQIQAMGYIVDVLPSTQVSPSYYLSVCSGTLIGLTGANRELAENILKSAFNAASSSGQGRSDFAGVTIDIRADSNGILGCKFVKYRQ